MDNKEQWLAELDNSKAVQNYFKKFNKVSVDMFKDNYVRHKSYWYMSPERNADKNESEQLQWIQKAFEHLEVIQQKKLFDVQCLWRAEKVLYKEIEICEDFVVWENEILNCPFIEPVNQDDIRLYAQYLQSNDAENELDFWESWQDYNELKEAYENNNSDYNFPEWYSFHNTHTGSGALLLLPDIRGEKEAFYYDLHFEEQRRKNKEEEEEYERNRDARPSLDYYDPEVVEYFVTKFESKDVQKIYKEYAHANRHEDKEERLYDIMKELLYTDEQIPIEAHYDWYQALELALKKYRCRKIAEALPAALEQYQMHIDMGIAFPVEGKKFREQMRKIWLDNILSGRRINGDPEDLNF
jgi:hypothetical protein